MREVRQWFQRQVLASSFLDKLPKFAHVLSGFDPVDDPDVGIMAVSRHGRRIRLHVNVRYFDENPEYFPGVLQHEVHHVVLGHVGERRYKDVEHRSLMQQAEEVSANEYICFPLPGDPALWKDFERFGFAPDQSTMERYRLLVGAVERGEIEMKEIRFRCCDSAGAPSGHSIHLPPDIERQLRERGRRRRGAKPGEELERVPPLGSPEDLVDWRSALASVARSRRSRQPVFWRPNRRAPHRIGEVPGRAHTPTRSKLLVGLDTSKSMPTPAFALIGEELRKLAKWSEVTVVECDAAIQRVYPFEGKIEAVKGRGGTDLRPLFAPEMLGKHQPDAVVYFTDGEGPFLPEPPQVPALWILTGTKRFPCPWGRQIRMHIGGDETSFRFAPRVRVPVMHVAG